MKYGFKQECLDCEFFDECPHAEMLDDSSDNIVDNQIQDRLAELFKKKPEYRISYEMLSAVIPIDKINNIPDDDEEKTLENCFGYCLFEAECAAVEFGTILLRKNITLQKLLSEMFDTFDAELISCFLLDELFLMYKKYPNELKKKLASVMGMPEE